MTTPHAAVDDMRKRIRALVDDLADRLPGQAPIQGFVHHNTLHGYQHLPFPEALSEARRLTGASGYLPAVRFRELFRDGRITCDDLLGVLEAEQCLRPDEVLFSGDAGPVCRRDVCLAALLHPLQPITASQLGWEVDERDAFGTFQDDVPAHVRRRLLSVAGGDEPEAIAALWQACLAVLGLDDMPRHPEEMLDLTPEHAEALFADLGDELVESGDGLITQQRLEAAAAHDLDSLLARVGDDLTLSGMLAALTGRDLLDELRPYLLRQLGDHLDLGTAAWHQPERADGFYRAWRQFAADRPSWLLEEINDWHPHPNELPDDPLDAIIEELEHLDLPHERWAAYLERLALELPGWSGMFLWRHRHPGHQDQPQPVEMLDYLAVRLVLERLFALRLCERSWGVEPGLGMLRWQFRRAPAEFLVRRALFDGGLPEYLASRAQRLVDRAERRQAGDLQPQWRQLARLIWTWRQSQAMAQTAYSVPAHAWPLFRLAQHLGLCARDLRMLDTDRVSALFDCLARLDHDTMGFLWLRAYENHYRDRVFNALANNHGRGRWETRDRRPSAQLVFCMDDREEGTRRHIEEIDPRIETFGAAAHFGVPTFWRGLDDRRATALSPVMVVPSHAVCETVRPGSEARLDAHRRRRGWRVRVRDALHHGIRSGLPGATLGIVAAAPVAAAALAAKVLAPRPFGQLARALQRGVDGSVPTGIEATVAHYRGTPAPDNVQPGFETAEQVQRVGDFLRGMGLTTGLAPLVVIMGHGSDSDNNPHQSAYNCGACSGNHSGPNARLFATMVNRPAVRSGLREQGVVIPDDCWFLGAEHDTCSDAIDWYDLDRLPGALRPAFERLDDTLQRAAGRHARERCRKFYSAPADPTPAQALAHVTERGLDFSQARPELGHATNACAFIGRRALSQGVFFDRRAFLISYDPTQDPDGRLLEPLLLANAPVGAGINLEYYFSTVDNEYYGAGSKVTHNLVGFFGVMDGTGSDLRTGLPQQMVEVHEAMRLQVVIEARTEVLTAIYRRQPSLQELIGNGWLLLAAKDPDSANIAIFDPAVGWVPWQGAVSPLPVVAQSSDYAFGTLDPLDPVLVAQPEVGDGV